MPASNHAHKHKLKPCPFCASTDLTLDNLADPKWGWFVNCNTCEIQQIASYQEQQAVERWNRRYDADLHAGIEAFNEREADDYPGPQNASLEAIWQEGITYGMDRIAACLNVTGWDRDGGSESVEGDVNHEIGSIMRKVAERRVLANGGTVGADGFDAAVDAILEQLAR